LDTVIVRCDPAGSKFSVGFRSRHVDEESSHVIMRFINKRMTELWGRGLVCRFPALFGDAIMTQCPNRADVGQPGRESRGGQPGRGSRGGSRGGGAGVGSRRGEAGRRGGAGTR
jgi:hypothetical protein